MSMGRKRSKTAARAPRARRAAGRAPAPRPRRRNRPARREDRAALVARAAILVERLEREYPDAHCSLTHANPFQLVIATILSAQCTDARVNLVTPALFARYPDAAAFAAADLEAVETLIRSTGFYHNKAKNIIACAQVLMQRHGGAVPADLESLVALPGVGRKTANVVLGNAFDIPGVVVDTHVGRLSQRLRLTSHQDPNKIELDLMQVISRDKWTLLAHLLIEHGRQVCQARVPRCAACVLRDLCPSSAV
jgi:endonuclease-3